MNIQITSINMRYSDGTIEGVQVYFSGNDDNRMLNINGFVPLTSQEYEGNESIPKLVQLVKQIITNKLITN